MSTYDELAVRWNAVMMPTYGVPPVALARGQGCRVWDVDGREYLDLIAGIAVSSLGHGHPAYVRAVSDQVALLAHTSNLAMHEPGVRLAERLLGILGLPGRVFFTNSGTEANEAALKLVRRHAGPGRPRIVATEHGFHGRTMGSLAITGKPSIREPFGPFGLDVTFVPFGDADALADAVDEHTAAVFLEPTQGEAGVVPAPAGYLAVARQVCDAAGALLVIDEIQSGIGRTGRWFAHQADAVRPDVLTLAKGLGGGLPVGACIGVGEVGDTFGKGDHGSTFGGNPVACAGALAVIDVIDSEGLLDHVAEVGESLALGLLAVGDPLVTGVRGSGLWRALTLAEPLATCAERAARDAGYLVNAVDASTIRIAPPLVISAGECAAFVEAVPSIMRAAETAARVAP